MLVFAIDFSILLAILRLLMTTQQVETTMETVLSKREREPAR